MLLQGLGKYEYYNSKNEPRSENGRNDKTYNKHIKGVEVEFFSVEGEIFSPMPKFQSKTSFLLPIANFQVKDGFFLPRKNSFE